jgi:hypothetical protein
MGKVLLRLKTEAEPTCETSRFLKMQVTDKGLETIVLVTRSSMTTDRRDGGMGSREDMTNVGDAF